jgi:transcriptional regulator with XRE-family HTH domain
MSTDVCKSFGKRIRQIRESKGIGQRELAEKVGMQPPHLSRIENGIKEPCLYVIKNLADGMGVSLRKVFWDV